MAGGDARGGAGRGILITLLVLVVLAAGVGVGYRYATGASGPSDPVAVDIPDGATAADVGDILQEAGVIRWGLAFRVAAGFEGVESALQAGTYDLRTNMTVEQALDALRAGPAEETVTVTFPEGLEVREVADVAASDLGLDPAAVEQAATSGAFTLPPYLPPGTGTVEGFLFPKTYEFPPEADADHVIDRLLQQFELEADGLPWQAAEKLGLSPYEVVIVASLVEREARVPA
ncbi:MAG TPA: endolytic transglycosylase MltG, partial [Actinomycetota bacterium]|nr:endolytic transglycosylase MltG [Actinomycetota bacterium]